MHQPFQNTGCLALRRASRQSCPWPRSLCAKPDIFGDAQVSPNAEPKPDCLNCPGCCRLWYHGNHHMRVYLVGSLWRVTSTRWRIRVWPALRARLSHSWCLTPFWGLIYIIRHHMDHSIVLKKMSSSRNKPPNDPAIHLSGLGQNWRPKHLIAFSEGAYEQHCPEQVKALVNDAPPRGWRA